MADHGGSVRNSYGYPAKTEGAVAVGLPDGRGYVCVDRLPANKVTLGGVFRTITGFSGLFDARFGWNKKAEAKAGFVAFVQTVLGSASSEHPQTT